jgi:hypothetical protein
LFTERKSGKGTSKRGRKKRECARNHSIWSFAYPRYHKLGIALSFCAVILCLIINLRCVSVAARNFAIVSFQKNTSSSSSSHLPPQQQPTPSRPKYVHPDLPAIPDLRKRTVPNRFFPSEWRATPHMIPTFHLKALPVVAAMALREQHQATRERQLFKQ